MSDFILTGRVRSKHRGGRVGPVQVTLARRLAEADPGLVVRHKERIAFVIVATPGKAFRLRDCVLTPMELLEQWDAYTIHTFYYIEKHVNAALQRCFGLAPHRISIEAWYAHCPTPRRRIHFWPVTKIGRNVMISSFFGSDLCSLCGKKCMGQGRLRASVCSSCRADGVRSIQTAMERISSVQSESSNMAQICRKCNLCFEDSTTFAPVRSISKHKSHNRSAPSQAVEIPLANCSCIDCPNTFERHRLREAELEVNALCEALEDL